MHSHNKTKNAINIANIMSKMTREKHRQQERERRARRYADNCRTFQAFCAANHGYLNAQTMNFSLSSRSRAKAHHAQS